MSSGSSMAMRLPREPRIVDEALDRGHFHDAGSSVAAAVSSQQCKDESSPVFMLQLSLVGFERVSGMTVPTGQRLV